MSALTARGSTRVWRRIRRAVLDRDGWRCQWPVGEDVCGARAVTAGHIIRRAEGGTDALTNLRAECAHHNYRDGALYRNGKRERVPHYRAQEW